MDSAWLSVITLAVVLGGFAALGIWLRVGVAKRERRPRTGVR